MNKLGFSVIYTAEQQPSFYGELFEDMLDAGCDAIELHMPQHGTITDPAILRLIGQFSYRAIHTSDLYSPKKSGQELAYYQDLAQQIEAMSITIHPHTMDSWGWLARYFGDMVSLENMDCFKPYGKTPESLQTMTAELPGNRWTLDLNHIFTNDASMRALPDFYRKVGGPGQYHISGFCDEALPHTTLHTSNQDRIITSVATDAPVIIESLGRDDIHLFRSELAYVAAKLAEPIA